MKNNTRQSSRKENDSFYTEFNIIDFLKSEKSLISRNSDAWYYSGVSLLLHLSILAIFVGIFLLVDSIWKKTLFASGVATVLYGTVFSISFFFIRKKRSRLFYPLSYALSSIIFATYMSVGLNISAGNTPSVSCICMFVLLPVFMSDKTLRINIFLIAMAILHIVLSIIIKKTWSVIFSDIVNTSIFCFVGIFIGIIYRNLRLQLFDKRRILSIQKDTDELTSLGNRRVLFNDLKLYSGNANGTINLMMIDIDFFKKFNDSYGHLEGDNCLRSVAECFKSFEDKCNVKFYRYGGEEFTALSNSYAEKEFNQIAENIRLAIIGKNIPFEESPTKCLTISAGCITLPASENQSAEWYIKQADNLLYISKNTGRNKVSFLQ